LGGALQKIGLEIRKRAQRVLDPRTRFANAFAAMNRAHPFRPFHVIGIFCGLLALPNFSAAALTWEAQQIDLTAKVSDKVATAVFHFTNAGQTPITITSVKPDCGCTTAELEKKTYAPGERGEIKTVFEFQSRVGQQGHLIQVTTDEAPTAPIALVLHVNILEPMTCSPRLLLWSIGGENSEKTATISANPGNRITSVEIKSTVPDEATTRIETVEAGKKYQVVAQPKSVAKAGQVNISCLVSFADGTTNTVSIFTMVR
jgi:hypothetical protein